MNKFCPNCGIDYKHIVSKRRLGCAFCYFAFKTEMFYVFREKQDNKHSHLGKMPKNYTNPINLFIHNEIEMKIDDEEIKKELRERIRLTYYHGD